MNKPPQRNPVTRIDSHQHFWLRIRGDYDWLSPSLKEIYRDFLPEDLRPLLTKSGMEKTILVQAADTAAETDFLLEIAEDTDFVAGVVGWVDMEKRNAISRLGELAQNPFFKGIRPMIQDIADDHWVLKPELDPVFRHLIDANLCFDALVTPRHLNALQELLFRYPDLKVVIDHGAKPDIARGNTDQWAADIALIAESTQAYCKLSGLITEAGAQASFDSLNPVMDHLLSAFGAKRLMWGSDWPVVNLESNYSQWANASSAYISNLPLDDQEWIWSKSAQQFYEL